MDEKLNSENQDDVKDVIKQKFSIKTFLLSLNSSKKIKLIIASVLFIVVLLIFFSSWFTTKEPTTQSYQNTIVSSKSYAEITEDRLKRVLLSINGVSSVEVFIYVSSTEEVVYLTDKEIESSSNKSEVVKQTTVFNKDGSSSSAIVVVTKYPKIEGVMIVIGGGEYTKLKLKIIDAVSCILSIAPTNIEVLEGKS